MRLRTTIVLAVLAALLGGAYYRFEVRGREARQRALLAERRVVSFDAARVREITIEKAAERVVLRGAGDRWRIVAPVDEPADESVVEGLLSFVHRLEKVRALDGLADLKTVGLDAPAVRLGLGLENGETLTLLLGGPNPVHTGVYAARADVGAVVHGHPPHGTALASTGAELALLTHDAVLFAEGLPRFEDPDLIIDEEQGDRVAAALGGQRALLLNNHGVLVTGKDVPWAVLTAVTLERAAHLQTIAAALGDLRPIERRLALQMLPDKYRDEFVAEYWSAWQRQLARTRGGLGGDRS